MAQRAHLTSQRVIDQLELQLDSFENSIAQSMQGSIEYSNSNYNESQQLTFRVAARLSEAQRELDRAERDYSLCMDRCERDDDRSSYSSCSFERQGVERARAKVNQIEEVYRQAESLLNLMRGECNNLRCSAQNFQSQLSSMVTSAKWELQGIEEDVASYNRVKATYIPNVALDGVSVGSAASKSNTTTNGFADSTKPSAVQGERKEAKHKIEIPNALSARYGVVNKMVSSDINSIKGAKIARLLIGGERGVVSFTSTVQIDALLLRDIEAIIRHNAIDTIEIWFNREHIALAEAQGYSLIKGGDITSGATMVKSLIS